MYVDADVLKIYEIDIENDILKSFQQKDYDKYKIRNAINQENKKRKKDNNSIIDTKAEYDKWATVCDFPICDELEECGFNDFKWLFSMKDDDYLNWIELKKVCKEYMSKYNELKPAELYKKMLEDKINCPKEPEIRYKNIFVSLTDLFYS